MDQADKLADTCKGAWSSHKGTNWDWLVAHNLTECACQRAVNKTKLDQCKTKSSQGPGGFLHWGDIGPGFGNRDLKDRALLPSDFVDSGKCSHSVSKNCHQPKPQTGKGWENEIHLAGLLHRFGPFHVMTKITGFDGGSIEHPHDTCLTSGSGFGHNYGVIGYNATNPHHAYWIMAGGEGKGNAFQKMFNNCGEGFASGTFGIADSLHATIPCPLAKDVRFSSGNACTQRNQCSPEPTPAPSPQPSPVPSPMPPPSPTPAPMPPAPSPSGCQAMDKIAGKSPGSNVRSVQGVATWESCTRMCCDEPRCKAVIYRPAQACVLLDRTYNSNFAKPDDGDEVYVANKVTSGNVSLNPVSFDIKMFGRGETEQLMGLEATMIV